MTKVNEYVEPQSIIFYTSLLFKEKKNYRYKDFVDLFVHLAINTLNSTTKPKISEEIRKTM